MINKPCFIIAEAGINHNGDIDTARRLAREAKNCGADAVKFQTFWNIRWLSDYELSRGDFIELFCYCNKIGIEFMSTPHDFEAIHFIDRLVNIHKVASCFMGVPNFLREIGSNDKPLLMSTGSFLSSDKMLTIDAIKRAISFIPHQNITLLHCVSEYPCVNSRIRTQDLDILGYPVGLSDHTKEIEMPVVPVLEKHFMLDNIDSIDECVSLKPDKFRQMVKYIREMERNEEHSCK
jgi:sialic acid synthase SpsE